MTRVADVVGMAQFYHSKVIEMDWLGRPPLNGESGATSEARSDVFHGSF